ncbi:MAG: ATP-dependent Clp protease adaptor ClpS [Spirochaetia bacterium]|jgi:ATP-dependent Clp protease adaptor protein ClpS|nr:ATP-dependent Clp protease adaptor ClpS [Spirochaetia bacterium]
MAEKRALRIMYGQHEATREQIQEPPLFHVVLLNDDYTTMEFVVSVIRDVFHQSPAEASRIMMEVHTKGKGIAGTYTRDIARTKAETVMHLAFEENYPLKCLVEKA